MDIVTALEELKQKALSDILLKKRFLDTRTASNPMTAFCRLCQELGYPVYEMDLIQAGEEFYAAMKRSTNGGGENSPVLEGEDDFYELFFAELES